MLFLLPVIIINAHSSARIVLGCIPRIFGSVLTLFVPSSFLFPCHLITNAVILIILDQIYICCWATTTFSEKGADVGLSCFSGFSQLG